MKGKIKMILLIAALAYFILLFDFYLTWEYKNTSYKIEYSGLVWVGLDYYTIIKYHSEDQPMKWIKFSKTSI